MIDAVIDGLFWVDIILSFRSGYVDVAGDDVRDVVSCQQHYLKGSFSLDLAAAVPVEAILKPVMQGSVEDLSVVGMTKSVRLLRLGRLMRKLDRLASANMFRIVKLMFGFLLFSHW